MIQFIRESAMGRGRVHVFTQCTSCFLDFALTLLHHTIHPSACRNDEAIDFVGRAVCRVGRDRRKGCHHSGARRAILMHPGVASAAERDKRKEIASQVFVNTHTVPLEATGVRFQVDHGDASASAANAALFAANSSGAAVLQRFQELGLEDLVTNPPTGNVLELDQPTARALASALIAADASVVSLHASQTAENLRLALFRYVTDMSQTARAAVLPNLAQRIEDGRTRLLADYHNNYTIAAMHAVLERAGRANYTVQALREENKAAAEQRLAEKTRLEADVEARRVVRTKRKAVAEARRAAVPSDNEDDVDEDES